MSKYVDSTLREVVEEAYEPGWDDFVVQFVNGVEGKVEEIDVEDWNNQGTVPSEFHEHMSSALGISMDDIDYEQLKPYSLPETKSPKSKRKKKPAKKKTADTKSPTVSDSDDVWEGVNETIYMPEPEEEEYEEPPAEADDMSEGFIIEDDVLPEPEDEEDGYVDMDIDDIEDEDMDLLEDDEDILDDLMDDEDDDTEVPVSDPEPVLPEPEMPVVQPIEPPDPAPAEPAGQDMIVQSVRYAEMILQADANLRDLIARLIGVPAQDIKTLSTEDLVLKLLKSNIEEIRSTAAKILDAKRKGSIHLGVWLGQADGKSFSIAASISEIMLASDDPASGSHARSDVHTVAQALDTLPEVSLDLLKDFANLGV